MGIKSKIAIGTLIGVLVAIFIWLLATQMIYTYSDKTEVTGVLISKEYVPEKIVVHTSVTNNHTSIYYTRTQAKYYVTFSADGIQEQFNNPTMYESMKIGESRKMTHYKVYSSYYHTLSYEGLRF